MGTAGSAWHPGRGGPTIGGAEASCARARSGVSIRPGLNGAPGAATSSAKVPMSEQPPDPRTTSKASGVSRRGFLQGSSGAFAAGVAQAGVPEGGTAADAPRLRGEVELRFELNGEARTVRVEPRTTLLSLLRHHLEPPLTGTKEVCDRGNCGACTVQIDGRPAYSCLTLAVDLAGRSVRTIEGVGSPEALHPVQRAFCEQDAAMCGFCTPGFVVATVAALEQEPQASLERVKERLSGNLCRCGTYPHIFAAVQEVTGQRTDEVYREEGR